MTITCVFPCPLDQVRADGTPEDPDDRSRTASAYGGKLVGYFMPPGGRCNIAWGLVAFDDLTACQRYREHLAANPYLSHEAEAHDPRERAYAEDVGLAFAAHLLRRNALDGGNGPHRGLTRVQQKCVVDYIREHLAKDLSLAELAAVAGMSASHFKSLFKSSLGLPVHQYIIRRRVERAMQLLSLGDAKLSEVAVQSGFADQSHMSRTMRRLIGMTPATVKKSARFGAAIRAA